MGAPEFWIDGKPASPSDLAHVALVNYGAYTSFRVEDGAARGLDLHLARLESAAIELFGEPVGESRLRGLMRGAVGTGSGWLRVSLFSSGISPRTPDWRGSPSVMVCLSPPPAPLARTLRLQPQVFVREAPNLKHVATFGLIRARRLAREAAFDDALFTDADRWVSEGSLWNIGLVRGDRVTWPQARMLAGVTQALIAARLSEAGLTQETAPVRLDDLDRFDHAFICNSATPACAVAAIGDRSFPEAPELIERLAGAWASNPPQPI